MDAKSGLPPPPPPPLPVAISECLTGQPVRYDGSDAASSLPGEALAGLLSFRPICPELGIGLGVPRPPVRLVGSSSAPRVLGLEDPELDVTEALTDYGRHCAGQLGAVFGYIFMERSPSCGLRGVKVYPSDGGPPRRAGRGAYARSLLQCLPRLPAEEGGRLLDPARREAFLDQVFAYAYWRQLLEAGLTAGRLIAFHARHKYLLMAHSVPSYRQAGRLLANLRPAGNSAATGEAGGGLAEVGERYLGAQTSATAKGSSDGGLAEIGKHYLGVQTSATAKGSSDDGLAEIGEHYLGAQTSATAKGSSDGGLAEIGERYLGCLLNGLGKPASRASHGNALLHIQGYFKRRLDSAARRHLGNCIAAYRRGAIPLSQPRGMLRELLATHPDPYIEQQIYLQPPSPSRNCMPAGAILGASA